MTKTNFTFRTDSELKAKFVEQAKANGTTATALLQQWMEDYINGKKPSTDNVSADSTYSTDIAHTDSTYSLESRIESLESKLSTLPNDDYWHGIIDDSISTLMEKRLGNLEGNLDYLIEKKVNSAIAQLEPTAPSIDNAHTTSTDNVSADSTYSTDNALTKDGKSADQGNKVEDQIKELIAKNKHHWETVASLTQPKIEREISDFLIRNGFEKEGFSFSSTSLTTWKNPEKRSKDCSKKTYLACKVFEFGILPYLPKK